MAEDASTLQLGAEFKDKEGKCRCLTNAEVHDMLFRRKEIRDASEDGGSSSLGASILDKTLEYTSRFSQLKNQESIKALTSNLKAKGLDTFQIASLVNLYPRATDEAKTLMPHLNRFSDEELEEILAEIDGYIAIA